MTTPGTRPIVDLPKDAAVPKPKEELPSGLYVPGRVTPAAGGESQAAPRIIGDGGASWRLKALKRAQEQAKEAGREFTEVVAERWGSVQEMTEKLAGSAAAPSNAHMLEIRRRQRADAAGQSGAVPHYLQEVGGSKAQMKRPITDDSLSWRRGERPRREDRGGSGRGADAERDGEGSREGADRPPQERGGRDGDDARPPQEREGREAGGGTQQRGRGEGDRGPPRERGSRHDDRRPREQEGREGGRGRERDGTSGRGEGQPRQAGHDRGRGAPAFRQRDDRRRPRENPEQTEMLRTLAGTMNTFANDGSFMEQFATAQPQGDNGLMELASSPDRSDEEAGQRTERRTDTGRSAGSEPAAAAAGSGGNQGVAAALRARLGGAAAAPGGGGSAGAGPVHNHSVATMLRAKLTGTAPPPQEDQPAGPGPGSSKVVALPLVGADGRAAPGAFGRAAAGAGAAEKRGKRPANRYGEDGQKERYYAEDDKVTTQELLRRAKHGDDNMDIDDALADSIMRKKRFKAGEMDADAEYDHDAGLEEAQGRTKQGTREQQQKRDRSRQIQEFTKFKRIEDSCETCFSSAKRPRHLSIAVGQHAYLALVPRGRLAAGHCCIATVEHTASMRQTDDHVWTEVRNFQKCLISMYMAQGKDVIFMETAMDFVSHRSHAVLEAIPVDPKVTAKAALYYKKAIEEAESEWSTHHAKRLIDIKQKGLRGSIPPNFPYFYVQFGYAEGYVHVIDDEKKFKREFGRQVLCGLLKLPPEEMHRRARAESVGAQQQWAAEFRSDFDQYDWTKALAD